MIGNPNNSRRLEFGEAQKHASIRHEAEFDYLVERFTLRLTREDNRVKRAALLRKYGFGA